MLRTAWRVSRKAVVATVGLVIVGVGVVLMFLPGPGTVVILVGLAVLATEFDWARRLGQHVRQRAAEAAAAARRRMAGKRQARERRDGRDSA